MSATSAKKFEVASSPKKFTLSEDQEKAATLITKFILDPNKKNFVLSGFAGTGKSTMLKHVINSLDKIAKLANIVDPDQEGQKEEMKIQLTATTNKAAGALMQTTGLPATTIHSLLGLALQRNPLTHQQELVTTHRTNAITNSLIIIDEAFMADTRTIDFIEEYAHECKILWVGDPAQLLPVGMTYAPLTKKNYEGVKLTEIIRQEKGNPIIEFTTLCRKAVETGEFFKFVSESHRIQHVDGETFTSMLLDSFTKHKGVPGANKILCWTNKASIRWNGLVKQHIQGTMLISVGDYVVCNSAMNTDTCKIRTDQTVQVTAKKPFTSREGVDGHIYTLDGQQKAFMPTVPEDRHRVLKALKKEKTPQAKRRIAQIEDHWIDLRDEFACTVNKAQGSTYGTVFIDLNDVGRCRNTNQLARLLYVATSRPQDRIVFTGDIR